MDKLRDCFGKKSSTYSSLSLGEKNEKKEEKKDDVNAIKVFRKLIPFLWPKKEYKIKLFAAIAIFFMVMAKVCNIVTPMAIANAINVLTQDTTIIQNQQTFNNVVNGTEIDVGDNNNPYYYYFSSQDIVFPVGWITLYFVTSFFRSGFDQIRGIVFNYVVQYAIRTTSLKTFSHLHSLSLSFHLKRQTGEKPQTAKKKFDYMLKNVLQDIKNCLVHIFILIY